MPIAYGAQNLAGNPNVLWVDANAAPGGKGAAETPFTSIQDAIKKAVPGTIIAVKAGEYVGNLNIPRTVSGTDDKPITIVSIDGPQAAHIIADNPAKAAIVGGGTENVTIQGFWVTGGYNGIQFSQNGYDFTDMIKNITIVDNFIEGMNKDGIKVNTGDNVSVINNQIGGGNDNSIDFMQIQGGVISGNSVYDNHGTSASILVKGGSSDVVVSGNYVVGGRADGISIGGWTGTDLDFRPGTEGFQASNITVENNVVVNPGRRPLAFYGAVDSTATNNNLQVREQYYTAVSVSSGNETQYGSAQSQNITITDNLFNREDRLLSVYDESANVTFENNNNTSLMDMVAGSTLRFDPTAHTTDDATKGEDQAETPVTDTPPGDTPASSVDGGTANAPVTDTTVTETPPAPEPTPDVDTPPPAPVETPVVDTLPPAAEESSEVEPPAPVEPEPPVPTSPPPPVIIYNGVGSSGDDILRDNGGALVGGTGDDVYQVNRVATSIIEEADGGTDTVLLWRPYHVLADNVENLVMKGAGPGVLIGNDGDNAITATTTNDFLVGRGGENTLTGGLGDDTFFVDINSARTIVTDFHHGDIISIAGSSFASEADLLAALEARESGARLTLGDGRIIDIQGVSPADLTAADFDFTTGGTAKAGQFSNARINASAVDHVATGTDRAESLYGVGNGLLKGGNGDDTYFLSDATDHIVERSGGGNDRAILLDSKYVLDANVENADIRYALGGELVGNSLANILKGGVGGDTLTGGFGADKLSGGAGADTFLYVSRGEGGDIITDFQLNVDHLDVSGLLAKDPGATIGLTDSKAGMRVEVHYTDGSTELLAMLANLHTSTVADILHV